MHYLTLMFFDAIKTILITINHYLFTVIIISGLFWGFVGIIFGRENTDDRKRADDKDKKQ